MIFNFYSIEIYLGYLYLKNGSNFNYSNYQIHFSIFHWAYLGESSIAYVVIGRKTNSHSLSAEFIKNPKQIDIKNILNNCDSIEQKSYHGLNISGIFYICSEKNIQTMYFQNKKKDIFIREQFYDSNNQDILEEYTVLLSSISPTTKDLKIFHSCHQSSGDMHSKSQTLLK
jgi:hypothetical protein